MDERTKGAWILHHGQKLQQIHGVHGFDRLQAAGKAGALLSALSSDDQTSLSTSKVEALAQATNINPVYELSGILDLLASQKLIEKSSKGLDVLGVAPSAVTMHTSQVLKSLKPSPTELAALDLSEKTSESPLRTEESTEYLSDTYKLSEEQTSSLLESSEEIGFVDCEKLSANSKIYFNGNLFRREDIGKTEIILSSLTRADAAKVAELDQQLRTSGCVLLSEAQKKLGAVLFDKLNAASMYDVNVVNNDKENVAYVTRPAAFSKYGNPFADDALDLAKALVSSLTYGMTRSSYERGQIRFLNALVRKLIRGEWVGPVSAIGQDYRALEIRGVVLVRRDQGDRCSMRLLKREVGEMALQVLTAGDGSEFSLLQISGSVVTNYIGPEANRTKRRNKQEFQAKKATRDLVMALRTGGAL